jgi:hypothetical protein
MNIDEIEERSWEDRDSLNHVGYTVYSAELINVRTFALISKVRELENELSSITKGVSIKIPTESMEQEIQAAVKRATKQLAANREWLVEKLEGIKQHGGELSTRHVKPIQEAKDAFIEAYRNWHNSDGAARLDTALAMGWAWKNLQQHGGEQS